MQGFKKWISEGFNYYHGSPHTFTVLKKNSSGIIWLTPDEGIAAKYATPSWNKNSPNILKVIIAPTARIVELSDLGDPVIRKLKDAFSERRAITIGHPISDEDWSKWADFGILEVHNGIWRNFLRARKVDGVTLNDTLLTSTTAHRSLALINPKVIISQSKHEPNL